MSDSQIEWRGAFENAEVNALHAEAFRHGPISDDWRERLERYSLGWVCARSGAKLIGFVNVAWDGGVHAFLLDTMVSTDARHLGIGKALVLAAVEGAKSSGCEWLHVDFEPDLAPFYFDACGFETTPAGLVRLTPST